MTRRRPPNDRDVAVVVLKMVADRYSHGELAVMRSLGRCGVDVLSAHPAPRTPAELSRYARAHIRIPLGSTETTVTRLIERASSMRERPVLVPTDDVGALLVADRADELGEVFRLPAQPAGLALQLADKGHLARLCDTHDIPTPQVTFPKDRDGAAADAAVLGYPVVIKSMDPRLLRMRPNARSVVLAHDRDELLEHYDTMEDTTHPNLMLQEYIPGGSESVWMFNGYFDERSECRVGFTGQKVRQYPRGTGATSLGICRHNEEVVETTRRMMRAIGYRGIVDMGYRYDERDGRYKLLDVNPRLGSSFRLFVDDLGLDVVRAMYLDLTGRPVPSQGPYEGRRWLVEPADLWSTAAYRREERLTAGGWLRSVRGVDEYAWFAGDDMKPFLAMASVFALQPLLRRVRRG